MTDIDAASLALPDGTASQSPDHSSEDQHARAQIT